ncbi:MAG: Fe-Mn family superoxide dismutase [Kordiimonadaceae bacterium]|nr:Fe-Mn family superoxide dismutase [Kordiimonadaceae bacterium]
MIIKNTQSISKRKFLNLAATTAASTLAAGAISTRANAQMASMDAMSGLKTGKMKPIRYSELPGFLSAAQIAPHYQKHYGGALNGHLDLDRQINEMLESGKRDANAYATMQRARIDKGDSALLHEVFFDGMTAENSNPGSKIKSALDSRFGSLDKWQNDFAAASATANGWAVLCYHKISGKLYNVVSDSHSNGVFWNAVPIIALDMYEHSYYLDYQNNKGAYITKFFDYIDWNSAEKRLNEALG